MNAPRATGSASTPITAQVEAPAPAPVRAIRGSRRCWSSRQSGQIAYYRRVVHPPAGNVMRGLLAIRLHAVPPRASHGCGHQVSALDRRESGADVGAMSQRQNGRPNAQVGTRVSWEINRRGHPRGPVECGARGGHSRVVRLRRAEERQRGPYGMRLFASNDANLPRCLPPPSSAGRYAGTAQPRYSRRTNHSQPTHPCVIQSVEVGSGACPADSRLGSGRCCSAGVVRSQHSGVRRRAV